MPVSRPYPEYPQVRSWLIAACGWLGLAVLLGWLTRDGVRFGWIYAENGPVESMEFILNAGIALCFAVRALRENDMISAWCTVLAAAFLAAALREFPRCGGFYEGAVCMPLPIKEIGFGAIALIAFAGLLYKRQNPIESLRLRWTMLFWPLVLTALFFGAAQLAEKASLVSYEEFLEFAGCAIAISLAVWLLRRT